MRVFLDQAEIGATLPEQIAGALAFVARNTRLHGRLQGVRREDRAQFPPEEVCEALAKAIAHRDYAIDGMRAWGLPAPRFEGVDRSFRVTLPGPTAGADR